MRGVTDTVRVLLNDEVDEIAKRPLIVSGVEVDSLILSLFEARRMWALSVIEKNKAKRDTGSCPFCGSCDRACGGDVTRGGHYVACNECWARGPRKPSPIEAMAAWRGRATVTVEYGT